MKDRTYIAIDLKSFYASVECRERGLDPLDTNLVVADESRTDKTICLAVTPSLKSYGISGRGRLFEVKQRVKEANAGRQHACRGQKHIQAADTDAAGPFAIKFPHLIPCLESGASDTYGTYPEASHSVAPVSPPWEWERIHCAGYSLPGPPPAPFHFRMPDYRR